MKSRDQVLIKGDADLIYRYVAEIERWPEVLPHYRSVQVLEGNDKQRTVLMRCVRSFGFLTYPCRWKAVQDLEPSSRRIRYRHLAGPARGMCVEWNIEQVEGGVLTSIDHEFCPAIPVIGKIYADRIVGPIFVRAIAGKTLATIKALVEGEI